MTDDISNHPSPFTFAEEPLTIVKGNDGKDYLKYESELYGFIAGDMLTMYNDPEEDTLHGMTYKVKDIQRIRTDDVGKVRIELKTGDEYTHRKAAGKDEEYTIIQTPEYIPADENDLWNTRRVILYKIPDIIDCMYKDVLSDRLMINCRVLGEQDKVIPYAGRSSVELAKIRNIIETFTEERYTEKGKPKTIRFKSNKENTHDALIMLADANVRNPFMERIRRVHWDGVERIDYFLYNVGCRTRVLNDNEEAVYLKIVGRGIFLSVLERNLSESYEPIKFIPVIMGEQDSGKSTLCKKLGLEHWYRSTNLSFTDSKKFYEGVQGCVIAELKEGTQVKKETAEIMKAFADETYLQYRKSYEPDSSQMPIMFSMIVTTNDEAILKDDTGNSRFYPVYLSRTKSAGTFYTPTESPSNVWQIGEDYVLQLWAEAMHLYKKGERWNTNLMKEEVRAICTSVQGSATQNIPGHDEITDLLDAYYPNVGDVVYNYEIKQRLESAGYYGKDLEAIMNRFYRTAYTYGFTKIEPTKIKIDGELKSVRGYRRIE